eukprot:1158688-Pelagomonas_calceolata.AAC.1
MKPQSFPYLQTNVAFILLFIVATIFFSHQEQVTSPLVGSNCADGQHFAWARGSLWACDCLPRQSSAVHLPVSCKPAKLDAFLLQVDFSEA